MCAFLIKLENWLSATVLIGGRGHRQSTAESRETMNFWLEFSGLRRAAHVELT